MWWITGWDGQTMVFGSVLTLQMGLTLTGNGQQVIKITFCFKDVCYSNFMLKLVKILLWCLFWFGNPLLNKCLDLCSAAARWLLLDIRWFIIDMGISSNIMKSPSPKCYKTFWDIIIYSDTLHWSDISPNRDLVTELDLIIVFDVITLFREVSIGYLQWVRLASRGRLLLRTPGPVPFGTCICSNLRPISPELVMSTYLLSFEHPSVLLFCLSSSSKRGKCMSLLWKKTLRKSLREKRK